MIHIIQIPNWHPPSVNQLLTKHWGSAGRIKSGAMSMIGAYGHNAGVTKATSKRSVQLTITLAKGQRGCDPDNYYKVLNDALVRLGYLKDDNDKWVNNEPVLFKRAANMATTITISEVV